MEKIKNIKSPFMCYCAKVIPLAFDESMSYYECLCNFYNYLKNEIMPAININADATNELQDLYVELKEYVDNYFDNLNISQEVNAKLDEMVENGDLQQIIAEYLQLESLWMYETVSDMKLAENLQENMIVETSGFHNYNDGGGAYYLIRELEEGETANEINIIALYDQSLVAEYLPKNNYVNLNQLGLTTNVDASSIFTILNTIIPAYNIKKVDVPSDCILNKVNYSNLSNVDFNFYGLITAPSSTTVENEVITFEDCNYININNFNITSTLDKTEPAPTDHVRESYSGSNRIAIKLQDCSYFNIDNSILNNMYWDFYIHGTSDAERTHHINITNTISNNASISIYSSYDEYITIDGYKCKLKDELGAGNHVFYFAHYSDNLIFKNMELETDGYTGQMIQLNNQNNISNYTNVYIENIQAKGTSFFYCFPEGNNVNFNNIIFNEVTQAINEQNLFNFYKGSINISNSIFNIKDLSFIRLNSYAKCEINSIKVYINSASNIQSIFFGSTNNEINSYNSYFKVPCLLYNSQSNNKGIFKGCIIDVTGSNYVQSSRNDSSYFKYIDDVITCSDNSANFSYQGGQVEYQNTISILNCFLYNYNNISSVTNDTTFIIVNSYKNNSLITTW